MSTHYDTNLPAVAAEDRRAVRFRRRLLNPRRIERLQEKSVWFRTTRAAAPLVSFGVAGYMLLFVDFGGEGENVFSPVRRMFNEWKHRFLTLSATDEKELQLRTARGSARTSTD
ncbi:hypothetical protein HDU76_000040 [Blyttiomyces sp. JEL0837]|nr:hypothetical protein HDU76_000040 [Blyttiomyces sp. JEL0837]